LPFDRLGDLYPKITTVFPFSCILGLLGFSLPLLLDERRHWLARKRKRKGMKETKRKENKETKRKALGRIAPEASHLVTRQ
jgi:hypothetical protein